MNDTDLFDATGEPQPVRRGAVRPEPASGSPRLLRPDRQQMRLLPTDLESLIDAEHPARAIWQLVEKLDLSELEAGIAARGDQPGRPAIDPRLLVSLWLYATSEAVASARELARLCEAHNAYRWICGGVHVNYHTLADFRVDHQKALDDLMTQVLAVLAHQGLVELKRVAQDGMKVRASAGAASFHREKTLKRCLREAHDQVERLRREGEKGDASARRVAAREHAARDRQERLTRALEELPKVRAVKRTEEEKAQARVSSTDPDARVMKMADGGYRPAYNVQLSTDTQTRVIVGVDVTNRGNDVGQLRPMLNDIEQRTGALPQEHLADTGFCKVEDIQTAADRGVRVYTPVPQPRRDDVDRHKPKPSDPPAVAAWRQRMGTGEAKEIYKLRCSTSETVNADLRVHRGLDRLPVRGIARVRCVVLWAALTYNILRLIAATREDTEV